MVVFGANTSRSQHAPALGRRTLTLVQSDLTLYRQLILAQTCINFCLPHATLSQPYQTPCRSAVTPAMALGLTDRVWSLE